MGTCCKATTTSGGSEVTCCKSTKDKAYEVVLGNFYLEPFQHEGNKI